MQFRETLANLDAQSRLVHIRDPVNPRFEIAALLHRYEGRPVLFENVVGGSVPVAGNLLSSMDLLCESLGFQKEEWIARLDGALQRTGAVSEGSGAFDYAGPDLDRVPILTHYPKDQGPYIT